MGLRRFQNFAVGALTAQRLNELVDAVARLEQRVAQFPSAPEPRRDCILARILDDGRKMKTEGCEGATPAILYKFKEVQIRTDQQAEPGPDVCLLHTYPPDGISSDRNAILLAFEAEPTLRMGEFVICHHIGMSSVIGSSEPKMVYATTASLVPSVNTYIIIGASSESSYIGVRADLPGTENETIVNLYEESDHYGADDDPQNECATLTPRRLRAGDRVFGYKIGNTVYTCAPTAWTVECLPCGPSGITPLNIMDTTPAKELMAADTVLRGR